MAGAASPNGRLSLQRAVLWVRSGWDCGHRRTSASPRCHGNAHVHSSIPPAAGDQPRDARRRAQRTVGGYRHADRARGAAAGPSERLTATHRRRTSDAFIALADRHHDRRGMLVGGCTSTTNPAPTTTPPSSWSRATTPPETLPPAASHANSGSRRAMTTPARSPAAVESNAGATARMASWATA